MITTATITAAVSKILEAKNKPYPSHTNRISSLDYPCERQLFYQRTAWMHGTPRDPYFQGILETGTSLEPLIERILSIIGEESDPSFRLVGQQIPTNDKMLNTLKISGHIDGYLQEKSDDQWKTVSVYDVKTSSPNIFRSIEGYDSLKRYQWTRAYRGQLFLYALAHGIDQCTLIFVNKSNLWDIKILHFPLDYEYAERLLQKAARINEAIEAGEPPEGVNQPAVCERCQWLAYCCPELAPTGNLKILDNDELEAILERMEELSGEAGEYRDLEKQRDALLTKGQDIAVGRFLITWKQSSNGAWRKHIMRQELTAAE